MARKFKRKLARRINKPKSEPVLSVEFIRKETFEKVRRWINRLIAFTINDKRITKN